MFPNFDCRTISDSSSPFLSKALPKHGSFPERSGTFLEETTEDCAHACI